MAQYVFTMNRVTKTVPPKRQILKQVSLSFFPGAKIGVLGLNGSGKSTVLKIMAGLDKEFEGEAYPMPGIKIGFLPQEPQLNAEQTVREAVSILTARAQALKTQVHSVVNEARRALEPERPFVARELRRTFVVHVTDYVLTVLGVTVDRILHAEAPHACVRFVPNTPDDPAALREAEARGLLLDGKLKEAAELFDAVAKASPTSKLAPSALANAGLALEGLGDRDGALERYTQVISKFTPAGVPVWSKRYTGSLLSVAGELPGDKLLLSGYTRGLTEVFGSSVLAVVGSTGAIEAQTMFSFGAQNFTFPAIENGRIWLATGTEGAAAWVTVTDEGPGIDPGRRHRLFQPFDRLGQEESGLEGTGVGLALLPLFRPLGGVAWLVALFFALENLFVFTLQAALPLGFNDGATLLYWWRRRAQAGIPR